MNRHLDMDDKEIFHIKKLIRETPVDVDLTERIVERTNIKTAYRQHREGRRGLIAVASAVAIFILITSTGFISPTMAAAIKQIPGMDSIFKFAGDLGLKTADEKGLMTKLDITDTHDGLTLKATALSFDGTRVSIGIERKFSDNELPKESLLQTIQDVELSINGESIKTYSSSGNNSIGVFFSPTQNQDMAILEFSDLKNQGGRSFPNKFELSLDFTVSKFQDQFKLIVPVEMNTENNLVLTPSIQRNYENIDLTFERIEFTPITTNLTTQIKLTDDKKISEFQNSKDLIGFDLFDENGKKINLISGNGWNADNGNVLITDTRFEPFESIPKAITIKPYKYIYKENSLNEFMLDADGQVKVEYIPELEITLPIISKQ